MPPRANWKGFLEIAELTCPVALYTAVSTSERIAFHTLDRATGHRVKRQFVDAETSDPVEPENQVKGYEIGKDEYLVLEPEEIAAAVPESDKILGVEAFVEADGFDEVTLDRPYYLAPSNAVALETFTLIREALKKRHVAALARAVLFRRLRTLLVRPHGKGLAAATLAFDYEIRSAAEAFDAIPEIEISGEMLDLAKHIISTKQGTFDPKAFSDRYEAALAALVRAKLEGEPLPAKGAPPEAEVIDLMDALKKSVAASRPRSERGEAAPRKRKRMSAAAEGKPAPRQPPRRKAG